MNYKKLQFHLLESAAPFRLWETFRIFSLQDCNNVQVRIVSHLQKQRGQLTVVGDDAQSIYNWRGASNHAFTLLKELLADPGTDHKLVKNYRSRPAILEVCSSSL